MEDDAVEWSFDSLSFLVFFNPYFQMTIGVVSLLISIVLFYVVIKIANNAFTANSAMSSSVSHYLGTMEGMRQSNPFLEWYSKRSFRTKSIIVTCSHIFVVLWSGIALFVSIDFNAVYSDRILTFLTENYALVHLRAKSISLMILGTCFTLFNIVYFFQLLYLNRGVWLQLNDIKPSISPRTWEILHHTSLLFLGIAVQPILSFIIPTALFIIFNFAVTSIESSALLNLAVWTTVGLYSSSPFLFYLLTLISFKVYRHHFFSIIYSPFSFIISHRPRRVPVSPHIDSLEGNKEVI